MFKRQHNNLRSSVFEGRYSYAVATTSFSSFAFNPLNLDDRAIAMSDLFGQWRLLDLRIQIITRETTYAHLAILVNEYHASAPTTVEELQDLPYYMEGSGLYGAPLPAVHVTRADFQKLVQLKWYNTNTNSAENEFEFFGNVYTYAPFATLNYDVLVTYRLEFGAPMDPTQALTNPRLLEDLVARRQSMRRGITSPIVSARRQVEGKWDVTTLGKSEKCQTDPESEDQVLVTPRGSLSVGALPGVSAGPRQKSAGVRAGVGRK